MDIEFFLGIGIGIALSAVGVFAALKILELRQLVPPSSARFVQGSTHPATLKSTTHGDEADQGFEDEYGAEDDAADGSDMLVRTEDTEWREMWKPLPGNVLELGATGFQIRLDTQSNRPFHPYKLITPEGRCILDGAEGSLGDVQKLGESMARDRGSFAYTTADAASSHQ